MTRKSNAIPDQEKGKQLEHYANGKDRTDGMHPGIRKKCPICNSPKDIGELSVIERKELFESRYKYFG